MADTNRDSKKGAEWATACLLKSNTELQLLKGSKKAKLPMRWWYFSNLNVLFFLTDVSYRCRECCIFLKFSHSFYWYAPLSTVLVVKFDIFFLRKHMRKKCKIPPVKHHDQQIRKPAKNVVYTHFYRFWRFCSTNSLAYVKSFTLAQKWLFPSANLKFCR